MVEMTYNIFGSRLNPQIIQKQENTIANFIEISFTKNPMAKVLLGLFLTLLFITVILKRPLVHLPNMMFIEAVVILEM